MHKHVHSDSSLVKSFREVLFIFLKVPVAISFLAWLQSNWSFGPPAFGTAMESLNKPWNWPDDALCIKDHTCVRLLPRRIRRRRGRSRLCCRCSWRSRGRARRRRAATSGTSPAQRSLWWARAPCRSSSYIVWNSVTRVTRGGHWKTCLGTLGNVLAGKIWFGPSL